MEQLNETAVRRIQKLLALANDKAATEAEAASAMEQAQAILAKYNLDMAVVQDTVVAGGTVEPQKRKRQKTNINRSAMYEWQRELWRVVAESNFCFWWLTTDYSSSRKGVKRHVKA